MYDNLNWCVNWNKINDLKEKFLRNIFIDHLRDNMYRQKTVCFSNIDSTIIFDYKNSIFKTSIWIKIDFYNEIKKVNCNAKNIIKLVTWRNFIIFISIVTI